MDAVYWGAGWLNLGEAALQALFGAQGAVPCGASAPAIVVYGYGPRQAGPYIAVWNSLAAPVPPSDD